MKISGVRRKTKGVALVLTIFALAVLCIIGFAMVTLNLTEFRTAENNVKIYMAYNYAMAGLSRAKAELKTDYSWATAQDVTGVVGEGTYKVSVVYYGSGSANKLWLVTSTGYYREATRVLKTWMDMESFAKFAYFTEREQTSASQTIWFCGLDKISGSAHTNGYFSVNGNPQFSDKVSSSNNSDSSYKQSDKSYKQGGKTYYDTSKFYQYNSGYDTDFPKALNGSTAFSFNGAQPEVPLPKDTGQIMSNADYKYTGNVVILLKDNATMVVTKNNGQSETVSTLSKTVHVSGQTNISGTLSGRLTIGSTGTITITDSILYKSKQSDVLGLVSEGQIEVDTDKWTAKNIEIDAAIMSLNSSFGVSQYQLGVARGTLKIFGCLIQKNRGAVGTFNSRTGESETGYVKNYEYDKKLVDFPPLNFPTTGNIKIHSWWDKGTLNN